MVLKPFLLTHWALPIIRIYRCSANVRALSPIISRGRDNFLSAEQQGLMRVRRRRRMNTPLICGISPTTHSHSVGLDHKERHNLIMAERKMKSRKKVVFIFFIIVIQSKRRPSSLCCITPSLKWCTHWFATGALIKMRDSFTRSHLTLSRFKWLSNPSFLSPHTQKKTQIVEKDPTNQILQDIESS